MDEEAAGLSQGAEQEQPASGPLESVGELGARNVWVNAYRMVAPNVPFGGSGHSGWGRESGMEAVREYTETKAIWIDMVGKRRDPFVLG